MSVKLLPQWWQVVPLRSIPRWHLLDEMRHARLELLVGALPELLRDDRIAAPVVRGTGLTRRAV